MVEISPTVTDQAPRERESFREGSRDKSLIIDNIFLFFMQILIGIVNLPCASVWKFPITQ